MHQYQSKPQKEGQQTGSGKLSDLRRVGKSSLGLFLIPSDSRTMLSSPRESLGRAVGISGALSSGQQPPSNLLR